MSKRSLSRKEHERFEKRYGKAQEARRPRIETVTYSMPIYWASYLINGDASSLDDDEIAEADAAIEDIGLGAPVDVGDSEFRHRGDYGRLAGDYADYMFHKIEGASEHRVADSGIDQAITDWNNGNAYRTGSLRTLIDAGLVAWGHGGWAPTRAGKQQGLSMNHLETNESHVARDFNTLDDLIAHARDELGATHVSGDGPETKIYFPRGGQYPYEAASVRRKGGYWHADGPGARTGVARLPAGAKPIGAQRGRRAAEARRGEARKYWVVDQVQTTPSGQRQLWVQVGHFHAKGAAERFARQVPGKTRVVHTFPGQDYPIEDGVPDDGASKENRRQTDLARETNSDDTARGRAYAQEQIQSENFHAWIWDQMAEAEKMRKRDPSSVHPLETDADFKRAARATLQQLKWDAGRSGDMRNESKEFVEGFADELQSDHVVDWLVDELHNIDEQIRGPRHEQLPLPNVHAPKAKGSASRPRSPTSRG